MSKLGPPYEETELRLVLENDGTVTLKAIVTTGPLTGHEVVLAENIMIDCDTTSMVDFPESEGPSETTS